MLPKVSIVVSFSEGVDCEDEVFAEDGFGSNRDEVRIRADVGCNSNVRGRAEGLVDDDEILDECLASRRVKKTVRDDGICDVRIVSSVSIDRDCVAMVITVGNVFVVVRSAFSKMHLCTAEALDNYAERCHFQNVSRIWPAAVQRDGDDAPGRDREVDVVEVVYFTLDHDASFRESL